MSQRTCENIVWAVTFAIGRRNIAASPGGTALAGGSAATRSSSSLVAGMEAAAATAVIAEAGSASAEPKELVLDSPFLFVAYETSTLAPLVLGWIGDPSLTR
ncbi:serpin family protein [Corynebacterium vitaeruminis]|uniref:serpin family protein n=1 Tax=Corynebacterium vitaeruminis TaxID=38305 RepID=UPI0035E42F35